MSIIFLIFLVSEHFSYLVALDPTFSAQVLSLFVNCLLKDHVLWPQVIVGKKHWSITRLLSEMGSCLSSSTNTQAQTNKNLHPHTQGEGRDQEDDQTEDGKTT